MHWLEKFRRKAMNKDGGRGISREELASMVKLKYGKCSATLIGIVESGGIIQVDIADQIAAITGATAKQRDSMVHESRRNGWTPPQPKHRTEYKNKPQPCTLDVIPDHARRVVAIDVFGNEVGRYESERAAAIAAGCTSTTVSNRCNRLMSRGTGEFRFFDCTWRFADEWDAMSESARSADIENALFYQKRRKKNAKTDNPEQVPEACAANQPG